MRGQQCRRTDLFGDAGECRVAGFARPGFDVFSALRRAFEPHDATVDPERVGLPDAMARPVGRRCLQPVVDMDCEQASARFDFGSGLARTEDVGGGMQQDRRVEPAAEGDEDRAVRVDPRQRVAQRGDRRLNRRPSP